MAEEVKMIQYLTFTLDDELVAVDASKVREILEMPGVTDENRVPDYIRRVFNLRGCEIPVIDMRMRFALQGTGQADNSCIIVIDVATDRENIVLNTPGSVCETVETDPSPIGAAPHWLRCRVGKNDFKELHKIFINAAFSAAKPEGDETWPL